MATPTPHSPAAFVRLLEHWTFAGTCVSAESADLDGMWETATELSYKEFATAMGAEAMADLNQHFHIPLNREPYVSFHRAIHRGDPALVMTMSAVSHIWRKPND